MSVLPLRLDHGLGEAGDGLGLHVPPRVEPLEHRVGEEVAAVGGEVHAVAGPHAHRLAVRGRASSPCTRRRARRRACTRRRRSRPGGGRSPPARPRSPARRRRPSSCPSGSAPRSSRRCGASFPAPTPDRSASSARPAARTRLSRRVGRCRRACSRSRSRSAPVVVRADDEHDDLGVEARHLLGRVLGPVEELRVREPARHPGVVDGRDDARRRGPVAERRPERAGERVAADPQLQRRGRWSAATGTSSSSSPTPRSSWGG